jgi:hypothetical protein
MGPIVQRSTGRSPTRSNGKFLSRTLEVPGGRVVSFALETLENKPYALEHIIDDRIDNTRNEYDQELARHGQAENWRY